MKWISIKERLPEINQELGYSLTVLVREKYENNSLLPYSHSLSYRQNDQWKRTDGRTRYMKYEITHWMEIEEPEDEMD